ncbi:hypothetical protein B0T13DRAFT_226744 [Neurospora crassa]|nr:hypothetical protein B0T13DRAFT_226744 [Neurospora crassa]
MMGVSREWQVNIQMKTTKLRNIRTRKGHRHSSGGRRIGRLAILLYLTSSGTTGNHGNSRVRALIKSTHPWAPRGIWNQPMNPPSSSVASTREAEARSAMVTLVPSRRPPFSSMYNERLRASIFFCRVVNPLARPGNNPMSPGLSIEARATTPGRPSTAQSRVSRYPACSPSRGPQTRQQRSALTINPRMARNPLVRYIP